ncbi:hypothetical protein LTR17_020987 [Elasticomyces elasticus]|nr:hypothetical protein LTR17_020987 [Elasticomyces elasticus]
MPTFDSIAPELRVQIYELVLHSDDPLKRTLLKEIRTGMAETNDDDDDDSKPIIINTAILFASRLIHREALTVFYKRNTIRICHTDICSSGGDAPTALSCVEPLLVNARSQLAGSRYPNVKTIKIDVAESDAICCFEGVSGYLRSLSYTLRYTGVASFASVMPQSKSLRSLSYTFVCTELVDEWKAISTDYTPERLDAPSVLSFEETLTGHGAINWNLCTCFARLQANLPLNAEMLEEMNYDGLQQEEFVGRDWSSDAYEQITNAILL